MSTEQKNFESLTNKQECDSEVSPLKDVAIGLTIVVMAFGATTAFAYWLKAHADKQAKEENPLG